MECDVLIGSLSTFILMVITYPVKKALWVHRLMSWFHDRLLSVVGDQQDNVKVYKVHTPFTPSSASASSGYRVQTQTTTGEYQHDTSVLNPVYSLLTLFSSFTLAVQTTSTDRDRNKFVNYETELGRSPGMVTCTTCREQVLTQVTYKVGMYAWLMCLLFILCG